MPDIVFNPNRARGGTDPTGRSKELLRGCRSGNCYWTCKSTAAPGDIYLFWVGMPIQKLLAIGVCASDVEESENDGWDWTDAAKGWFCDYKPLVKLDLPVSGRDIKDDPILSRWWREKPYRGRPKSIDPPASSRLIALIAERNSRAAKLLTKHGVELVLDGSKDASLAIPDDDANPPPTVKYVATRRIRSTAKGERLKRLYRDCQVCGTRIGLPGNPPRVYLEIHHLRPLGGKHRGKDNWDNMLVLCPNCHAAFDLLAMAVHPKTGCIRCCDDKRQRRRRPTFHDEHALAMGNVKYHWNRFCEATN